MTPPGSDPSGGPARSLMNPSTAQALVFVDELVRCGARDAVVSPGSRSAPLALALHKDARVRLHVRVDERSAGFLAVGLAGVSRRPVVVVCTSGTAAANLHPAVLEAAHAHVPLVVLTADRPPELRQTGANQTIDQIKLYGDAVRFFAEVGTATPIAGQVAYWRSLICRAYAAARSGPVHLNVPFREPLVPGEGTDWVEALDGRPDGRPWVTHEGAVSSETRGMKGPLAQTFRANGPFIPRVGEVERGAVVVGAGAAEPEAAVSLAQACAWPLLSEPTGNARQGTNCISTYPLLLADPRFASDHSPDIVITVGKPGLSRSLLSWLSTAGEHIVVDPHDDWPDPTRTATHLVSAIPRPPAPREPTDWLRSWLTAEKSARTAIDVVLEESRELTEPRLARDLVATIPDNSLIVVASSKPIRDLEFAAAPRAGIQVVGNRGINGIDGLVSAAVGAALAWQASGGGHAYALLGDLAYIHDRNGLVLGPDEPRPDLTIVVADNNGGGIFSLLPQAGITGFERIFGTPPGLDLVRDAAGAGVQAVRAGDSDQFAVALAPAYGIRVVHVRTDRAMHADLHRRLIEAVRSRTA